MLPGALAVIIAVLVLGVRPAVRAARTARPAEPAWAARPSRAVAAMAAAGAPPTVLIGVRRALERGRDRTAVPVGPAFLGSILAFAALCATAVFGASLSHLTGTPALYGVPFDLEIYTNAPSTPAQIEQVLASAEHDRARSRSCPSSLQAPKSLRVDAASRLAKPSARKTARVTPDCSGL